VDDRDMTDPVPLTDERPPTRGGSFLRAASLTYATNLAVAGLSLLNVLIIARALGPDGRGEVAFLITVSLVSATIATLGVQQASANLAGTDPAVRPSLATNALVLSLLNGAIASLAIILLIVFFPAVGADAAPWLLGVALAAIPIQILRSYFVYLVLADYGFGASNLSWIVGPAVNVVANGAIATFAHLTVGLATIVWAVGQALGVAILAWYVHRKRAGYGRPDLGLALRTLRFGTKAHIGNIMLVGNYRMDQWFTGSISGARELGYYSVAVAWAEGLFFLPTALASVQRPDVVRASREQAAQRAAAIFRAAIILTVPIAVGLFLAAPVLCGTIFGEQFRAAVDDLRLLIPGAFGVVALKLLGSTLTAQGFPTRESLSLGVSFLATLVLDVLLIPRWGGEGAAIASSAAYCLGGGLCCFIFARTLGCGIADLVPRAGDLLEVGRSLRLFMRRLTAGLQH
jgi:O-antigen/teichoic acid export membrane protein